MAFPSRIAVLLFHLFVLLAQRVASTPYAITGVTGYGVHPRLEIRTMIREHPLQYNLYLLAFRAFQAEDEKSKLSYFQVAGIHGIPYKPWDGVQSRANANTGYCMHDEVIFGTWHRPYLALFEQRLQHHAMQIARNFKGKKREMYMEEAKKIRSVYWDWARPLAEKEDAFPRALSHPSVSVETPDGRKTIPNPFAQFHFHPLHQYYYGNFNKLPNTVRWPVAPGGITTAHSNNSHLLQVVTRANKLWNNQIYRWFVNCPHYYDVNDAPRPKNTNSSDHKCGISLESIHGDVHVTTGGYTRLYGHMTDVPVAANDPLFWLHHTNIDRFIAMWQAIYPKEYVYKSKFSYSTFVYKHGEKVDQDTALKPFHRNVKGDFWTSRQARDVTAFHYTYPELQNGGNSPAAMRKQVNELYAPKAVKPHANLNPDSKRSMSMGHGTIRAARNILPNAPASPLMAGNSSSFEYVANIVTTKYTLGGSYSVFVFLGQPTDSNPETWLNDPNLAGSAGIFSNSQMTNADTITKYSVSLTEALTKKVASGIIEDLTEAVVVPLMTKLLEWKVVGPDGTEIDPASIPKFLLSVFASTAAPITNLDQFPEWSPFIPLPSVTHGKPGGISQL